MTDTVIRVENLSKIYKLTERNSGDGLRHYLQEKLSEPYRWLRRQKTSLSKFSGHMAEKRSGSAVANEFRALDDVSFEVKRGDVVGIVGRNGAGKSTLLKILSRITEPTRGRVEIDGRVASLLEVGTGFHPELTGRENIYLNGAILGMKRTEVRQKFAEIVEFAEVEKFLDTPVKRYSSGMYVRLAFAVAAHLEPEILIVDEVLAVGDIQFQKKCLGKISEVAKGGRTIMLVSHNMSTVANLCRSGVLLQQGKIVQQGSISEIVSHYLTSGTTQSPATSYQFPTPRRGQKIYFTSAAVLSFAGVAATEIDVREPFIVRLSFKVPDPLTRVELSLQVLDPEGRPVFTSLLSECDASVLGLVRQGEYRSSVTIPGMFLMPGKYIVHIAAHQPAGELYDRHESVLSFTIHDTGTAFAIYNNYAGIGAVLQRLPWTVNREKEQ